MKNASLVLNAVLAVAVAVLYYLHFSENKTTGPVSATTTKSAPVRKTVYVNVDSLLTNYEYFKDTRKVLESKRFQLDNELNNKGRSLQNEVAFFQQRAQTMTMEQGRATEAALQKKQQDLVAYRDRIIQQLSLEEQKKNEELYNQIHDYLRKVNKQNQFDFVMGYSRGGGILYADSTLDATKTIIAGLNKEYQEKQTKK